MKFLSVTIQMSYSATLSCGAVYYSGVQMFLWMKSLSVTIQMKTVEQWFPVVLFTMVLRLVQTFEPE